MGSCKTIAKASDCEEQGLNEMRCLIEEFLSKRKGSSKVREYLSSVIDDKVLLLIYLKGRKYRVKHAWETLKHKAEIRFDDYPEIFPDELPSQFNKLLRDGTLGLLKGRDNSGARIIVWNGEDWNTDDYNLEHITIILANAMDKLLFDEDIMNHGLTLIVNSNGLGLKHGMQFTLSSMLRLVHVFWYAYPIRIKGVYFVNVAIYLQYLHKLARPLFPKKLKERFFMTSDKKFEALYEAVSPKVLPKFLGGVHKNEDCFDLSYLTEISQND